MGDKLQEGPLPTTEVPPPTETAEATASTGGVRQDTTLPTESPVPNTKHDQPILVERLAGSM